MEVQVSEAIRHLTYDGDARDIVGQVRGPDTRGRVWQAVTAEFDGARTRVGFVVGTIEEEE